MYNLTRNNCCVSSESRRSFKNFLWFGNRKAMVRKFFDEHEVTVGVEFGTVMLKIKGETPEYDVILKL